MSGYEDVPDSFFDTLGAAPEEGTTEPVVEEPDAQADNAPEGRPRNEKGQFVPVNPEPPQAQPEGDEPEPEPELILGKFRSTDDLIRAYQEVEGRLGQQGSELGEMRKLLEQVAADRAAPPQPVYMPDVDELLEENPTAALEVAWRSNDQRLYQRVYNQVQELVPGLADTWVQNKRLEWELAQVKAKVEDTFAASQETRQQATLAEAYAQIKGKYPDFDDRQAEMAKEAARYAQLTKRSIINDYLNAGDVEAAVEALDYLYTKAGPPTAENLTNRAKELAQTHAETVQQVRKDALVAPGQGGSDPAPRSPGQEFLDEIQGDEEILAANWHV